jgi:hypothetical protein
VQAFVQTSGGIGLIAGALSVAGYLAFLTAAKVLPLAPIAALRECGLIFGPSSERRYSKSALARAASLRRASLRPAQPQ